MTRSDIAALEALQAIGCRHDSIRRPHWCDQCGQWIPWEHTDWPALVAHLRATMAEVDQLLTDDLGGWWLSAPSTDPIGQARDLLRRNAP